MRPSVNVHRIRPASTGPAQPVGGTPLLHKRSCPAGHWRSRALPTGDVLHLFAFECAHRPLRTRRCRRHCEGRGGRSRPAECRRVVGAKLRAGGTYPRRRQAAGCPKVDCNRGGLLEPLHAPGLPCRRQRHRWRDEVALRLPAGCRMHRDLVSSRFPGLHIPGISHRAVSLTARAVTPVTAAAFRQRERCSGSAMVKTHPIPGISRTDSVPKSASTLCRAMARPRPSPVRSAPRCVKGLKIA